MQDYSCYEKLKFVTFYNCAECSQEECNCCTGIVKVYSRDETPCSYCESSDCWNCAYC